MNTDRLPVQVVNAKSRMVNVLISGLREAGLDPVKAARNQMVQALAIELRDGRFTYPQFVHACQNVGILNEGLKL